MRHIFSLAFVCCLALTAAGEDRSTEWKRSWPEAEGMDSGVLAPLFDFLAAEKSKIHGLIVVRHGAIVLEAYFPPFEPGARHDVASCTKTVTAMLVGIAIEEGKIAGPEAKFFDLFLGRPIKNLDQRKESITLADLLTMRSGLFCVQDALSQFQMFHSPNWTQFCLDLPAWRPPGKTFQYFSLNSHLLSAAVQQATGTPAFEYAKAKLFGPLGIASAEWPADPQGVTRGWGDLRLTCSDMARLGLLFLQKGKWNGETVVAESWLKAMTTPRVEVGAHAGYSDYGYQIWISKEGYSFRGRGGQRIIILPKEDLIVAAVAGASDAGEVPIDELVPKFILPSIKSAGPITENPKALSKLQATIAAARLAPTQRKTTPLPELAKKISGVRYELGPNPYLLDFTLTFKNDSEASVRLSFPSIHRMSPLELTVGLDGVARISPGRYGEPAALSGEWKGSVFHLDFDEIGNINHWTIRLDFGSGDISLVMSEETDLPTIRVSGRSVR